MRLHRISWANYRRLPDSAIHAQKHIVLVGPNDSGKSSVLWATHMCLGMTFSELASAIQVPDLSSIDHTLRIEVELADCSDDDRAAFPDEISVGPPETLTIVVEATFGSTDPESKVVRRFFPDAGHTRGPSRVQLAQIGWQYVPANRSLLRELGSASGGAARSLLSSLDLGGEADQLQAAATTLQDALDTSPTLTHLRETVASALSDALPRSVAPDDIALVTDSSLSDEPLSGVTFALRDGGYVAPLTLQSDGIRALSVLAILGLTQQYAQIVGIDEPEIHLHPAAQRAIGRSLQRALNQRVVITHSPAVVARMEPGDIVAFSPARIPRQLARSAEISRRDVAARHWSDRLIEPLTARSVVLVEGAADRILIERIGSLVGIDLDRRGVSLFELGGAEFFPTAYRLFGEPGFCLQVFGVVDTDHRLQWAKVVDVSPEQLPDRGYVVMTPDLEGDYVRRLGVDRVLALLAASSEVSQRSYCDIAGTTDMAESTEAQVLGFCRHAKHKTRAALAVAGGLTPADASTFSEVCALLTSAAA